MKKLGILLTAFLLLFSSLALADDTQITVQGSGTVYVSADIATINLGVSAQNANVKAAQESVNTALNAIRQVLQANGVALEDISTDTIYVYSMWDYDDEGEESCTYYASSSLAIRTTNLDQVGTLIDLAFEAGANTLSGVTFDATDTDSAREAALRQAIASAKATAGIMADECGLTLKGIEEIESLDCYTYATNTANFSKTLATDAAAGDTSTKVQPAKISVTASVRIVYEAK